MSARIYSLTCNITGLMYIGSTRKTLQERLAKGKTGKITAFDEIIPLNDYRIELIEEIPECTDQNMASREGYWQLYYSGYCVNKKREGHGLSRKEYQKRYHANYDKKYYQKNKDWIKMKREAKKREELEEE